MGEGDFRLHGSIPLAVFDFDGILTNQDLLLPFLRMAVGSLRLVSGLVILSPILPVKQGLWEFLDQLDELVIQYGGRVYLAKDARLSPEAFRAMYPSLVVINK